jgi:hypothetical protein
MRFASVTAKSRFTSETSKNFPPPGCLFVSCFH